jgi:hypothetical protein
MRKGAVIGIAVACLMVGGTVAYVHGVQQKLKTAMSAPGITLDAGRFSPVSVPRTERVDLGYARVSVPGGMGGELVRVGSSNFVCLVAGNSPILTFCPPADHRDADSSAILKAVSSLNGAPVGTWYEFQKLELAQRPLTIWRIAGLGRQRASACLSLLSLKAAECSDASAVRIFENERIGAVVWTRTKFTRVMVAGLKSGVSQDILIARSVGNADEIISALLGDYEMRATETDADSIGRLIEGVGLRVVSAP